MASVVRLVFSMIGEVCRFMEKDMERHERLYVGLQYIKKDMEMVKALLKDKECRGAIQETRIRQLQELAYDVEDFLEGLWKPGAYGKVLVGIGMDPRAPQLIRIDYFKERFNSVKKEWEQQSSDSGPASQEGDEDSDDGEAAAAELDGIDGPKRDVLELLSPSPGEGQQLRVISIVGCRGVGKTALARAVYEDRRSAAASGAFDCVAWVVASGCNDKNSLLHKVLQNVRADLASRAPENVPVEAEGDAAKTLQEIMSKNRCLVFIDDVQKARVWKQTVDACKKNGSASRIIVTTRVRSVAIACSSGSYVYSMQCLCHANSESLFWRKVYGSLKKPPTAVKTDSESIFRKCGGLPLALTSVARHLNMEGNNLNSSHCKDVGDNLGSYYLSDKNEVTVFKGIRRALMQSYSNLPDYDHRVSLLYLSIFPRGHQIKSKMLERRLIAEGLVASEGCRKCFDQLIDHCIVHPVQVSNNSVDVKSYQVHDIVLEYIIHKSLDKNLVALIQGREPLLIGNTVDCVRRLSVQSSTEQRFEEIEDKSAALRSLTMFSSEAFDLHSCKLLRLLDLEGCSGLDRGFLDGLCELLLLRYLSLRKTGINELPAQIEKLQRLEMLDIRETKVAELPIKVLMLPKLAYLFGRFQLSGISNAEETNKLSDFLKKKSVLHTVSGYVANNRQAPEHVILLARHLKKVKVWCKDTGAADTPRSIHVTADGSSSSQRTGVRCGKRKECNPRKNNFDFIRLLKERFTSLESVSIVSSGLCKGFMGSLEGPCFIGSIKLRGNLDGLPDPLKLSGLDRIKKLQLFSTGLTINDLSVLQHLRGLEYLRLVENYDTFCSNGIFIVEKKGFESLKSLCIEAQMVPELQFKEGAMENLTSLHLLCPDPRTQVSSETVGSILHLATLSEVMLHSSMHIAWETVAEGHPNRPCVKRQPELTAANTEA